MNPTISIKDFKKVLDSDSDYHIIDVRTHAELQKMPMIENSIHIPMDRITEVIDVLPDDKPLYIVCALGVRADRAATMLRALGKNAVVLKDGIFAYYYDKK